MFTTLILIVFAASSINQLGATGMIMEKELDEFQFVHVGVVLNLNSSVGSMSDKCLSMALDDFYDLNYDYKTRLVLHKKHSEDVGSTALSVLDLLERDEVVAIIGSQSLIEAAVLIDIGRKFQIPVITFAVTSTSISPAENPYFIRTSLNDSYQIQALTEFINSVLEWQEIVLIYEDTIDGNGFIPYLTAELLTSNIKITYKHSFVKKASDSQISKELNKLKALETQVFLVHMLTSSLAYRIFDCAKDVGLMRQGYYWIITDGLSNSLPIEWTDSMEGLFGIRHYIPKSRELANFKVRWKKQFYSMQSDSFLSEPNIFGLWAYDTVWSLAKAVEDSWTLPSPLYIKSPSNDSNPFSHLSKSQEGSKLLENIWNSKPIQGLSGEFHIVDGQLEPLPLEIFDVVGNEARVVGFWTPDNGLLKSIPSPKKPPRTPKKLKIALAMNAGFPGLVQLEVNQTSNEIMYKGYCIDVFRAAVETLPASVEFEYELLNYPIEGYERSDSAAYDKLLYHLHFKAVDAVVGDLTISAHRFVVDFTLPYSDPGIAIVAPKITKPEIRSCIFFNFKHFFLGLTAVVGAVIATLLFFNFIRENLWHHWRMQVTSIFGESKLGIRSFFMVIAFGVLTHVIVSVYPGNYNSPIIVENQNEKLDLNSKDVYIGYQFGSKIVRDLLLYELNIDVSRIRGYTTLEEYDMALCKGSARGGVSAIIDETPYLKLFLAKYGSKYKFDGRTYKSQGFGFAFPLDSPLVSQMSKGILSITNRGKIEEIEHKYFRIQDSMENRSSATYQTQFKDFGGLF